MVVARRLHGYRKLLLYVPLALILGAPVAKVSPLARDWMIHLADLGFTRVETALPALALAAGIAAVLLGPCGFYLEPLAASFLGLRGRWTAKKCKFCGREYFLSQRISWTNDMFCSSRCMRRAAHGREWSGPAVPEPLHRLALALKTAAFFAATGAVGCSAIWALEFFHGTNDTRQAATGAALCAAVAVWLAVSGRGLRALSRPARIMNIAFALGVLIAAPTAMLRLRFEVPAEVQAPFIVATVGQAAVPVLRYALMLWTLFAAWSFWYLANEAGKVFAKPRLAQEGGAERA